jgi:putative FmdB family regulatory protein
MPTYTYACKNCGHRFDQRQSFADPALTDCPQCAGSLRKVLNSVGVVFKGSGFYRTDSRSQAKGALAGAVRSETGSAGSDKASSEGKAKATSSETAKATSNPSPAKESSKQPAAVH